MVAKNRKQGIKNISKYLYLLLNALRKLTRSYYKQLYRCISVLVKLDYDSFEKKYIPYLKGNEKTFWGFTSTSPNIKTCKKFLDEKTKMGTIFSLIGDLWGYDITLFNICGENEILLEPERKFIIEESIPEINGIIYVRCLIKKTPIIFENSYIKEQLLNCPNNIFEYINDKTKLNIVKYNKRFQKEINLDIMNYRRFSRKYILYEAKGKGKKYYAYNDELIFEGEFFKGKRWNGKGKEFDNQGLVVYEGEYLNGKWNGYGKEYKRRKKSIEERIEESKKEINGINQFFIKEEYKWDINFLLYEGEFIDGVRNGKGKEYDYKGKLIFEGEYLNGEKIVK